jgi:hypothetical protein
MLGRDSIATVEVWSVIDSLETALKPLCALLIKLITEAIGLSDIHSQHRLLNCCISFSSLATTAS